MTKKITSTLPTKSQEITAIDHCPNSALRNLTVVGALLLGLVAAGCTKDPVGSTPASSAPAVAPAPQAATEQAKATIYKCPMHPEITSDKPGKCSVCGMNLEKVP